MKLYDLMERDEMKNSPENDGRNNFLSTDIPIVNLTQSADVLMGVVGRGVNRELAAHGLTPLDFAMLRHFLTRREWTATELSQTLPVEVSAISRMVTKLVNMGLITRRRSRRDRRVVFLRLTEVGTTLGSELKRRVGAYEDRLTEEICDQELDAFFSVVGKILSNYKSLAD